MSHMSVHYLLIQIMFCLNVSNFFTLSDLTHYNNLFKYLGVLTIYYDMLVQ